jgi:hypothetical protein
MQPSTTPQTKYTVTCDWFECFLKGNPIIPGAETKHNWFDQNRICLVQTDRRVPQFKNFYEVWIDGTEFGYIMCNPTNERIIKGNMMQLKVRNERLYEARWTDTLQYFMAYFQYSMMNITRLDIALDGHGFIDVANRWHNREFECVSVAEFKPTLSRKMNVKDYHFGGIASDKNLKCYIKSQELEFSNKHYIRDYWVRSGLDLSKPVERLELSLRNDYIKTVSDFDWSQSDNFEYLASMMRTACVGFYQFAYPVHREAIKKQPRFDFIDWASVGGVLLERNEASRPTDAFMLKQAAKTDYFIYLRTGKIIYLNFAREKAINCNCMEWFVRKVDEWERDFKRRRGENSDGLITLPYISDYKEYHKGEQILIFNS